MLVMVQKLVQDITSQPSTQNTKLYLFGQLVLPRVKFTAYKCFLYCILQNVTK